MNGRRFTTGAVLLLSLAMASSASAQSAPAQRQIEATKLSKLPKLKTKVEPLYPPEALEKGVEGDVVLLLDIGADGKVTSVGIAEPATPPGLGFEEAAVLAAQQFAFEPAEVDGQPIAVQINYHFKFKPPTKAPPVAPVAPPTTPAPAAPTPAAPTPPAAAPVTNFAGTLRERGTRLPLAGALVTVFRDDGEKPL
ncbi:MAG TPA: energy transducer TonB, partial [Polyangia bacterium]